MYKLSICIYLNHVPFDACQKSYEFKSSVKFGTSKKKFKIPWGRTIFWLLCKKLSISGGYLDQNFSFFITLIWLDFWKEMWFLKPSKLTRTNKHQARSTWVQASKVSFASEQVKCSLPKLSKLNNAHKASKAK